VASVVPGSRPAPPVRTARPVRAAAPPRRSAVGRLAWALWALADAALIGVVAAGLAAAVLPPGPFWWAQLAAVGLPYAAGALALATAIPVVARRWPWVLVHVALVGLAAWRAVPGETRAASALGAPAPGSLVLTTFNLPTYGPSADALADSAVAFVRRTSPDVLLLQDAWAWRPAEGSATEQSVQVEAVDGRLPYRLALPPNLPTSTPNGTTSTPVLVRTGTGVEVVEQENVPLGGGDEAVSLAIRTQLRWRGREFVVYNVHLRSFGEDKPWNDPSVRPDAPRSWVPYLRQYRRVYAERGEETERLARRIEAETLPVVVAGDFNSTADNWNVRRLKTAGRPAGSPRVDAFRAVGGRTWGRTYHARRPLVRIDFVLVDPALDVVGADVADVAFSDHRPVRTHLRWAAAATPAGDGAAQSAAAPAAR
jgi:endonuclease/exonuclease/phosphatase family metal-dependent hydrolase